MKVQVLFYKLLYVILGYVTYYRVLMQVSKKVWSTEVIQDDFIIEIKLTLIQNQELSDHIIFMEYWHITIIL